MPKHALILAKSCLLLAGLVAGALAHATGLSKIDLTLRADTLESSVSVNRDDLFYALGFVRTPKLTQADISDISDRIAFYYQTRLVLKFDGVVADNMRILAWRKHGEDPALKLDSASLFDTTIVLKYAWPIPKGAKRLEVSAKLFAEVPVQQLSHVRIFYRGQEISHRFLNLDNLLFQPLESDSLEAAYTRATLPPPAPGTAAAQDSKPEESVVIRFIGLGFTHILPQGKDHILFVLGLFFFSIMLRPLLVQVTAFTVAHSLTLGLSLFNVISLSSKVVEPLIALSIAVVAIENIFFRKMRPSRFLIVFGFGLIHGLGFAGVLKELGLPEGQFLKVLVSFNVGVELGQLTVIAAAAALTAWMWKKPWYLKRVVIPASASIAAIGLFWFIQRILLLQS